MNLKFSDEPDDRRRRSDADLQNFVHAIYNAIDSGQLQTLTLNELRGDSRRLIESSLFSFSFSLPKDFTSSLQRRNVTMLRNHISDHLVFASDAHNYALVSDAPGQLQSSVLQGCESLFCETQKRLRVIVSQRCQEVESELQELESHLQGRSLLARMMLKWRDAYKLCVTQNKYETVFASEIHRISSLRTIQAKIFISDLLVENDLEEQFCAAEVQNDLEKLEQELATKLR